MQDRYYDVINQNNTLIVRMMDNIDEGKIPNEQVELKKLIEETAKIINNLPIISKIDKERYLNELVSHAQLGLGSATMKPNPKEGCTNVLNLQNAIMENEGEIIKQGLSRTMSLWTWAGAAVTAVLGILLRFMENGTIQNTVFENIALSPYLFVMTGSFIGVWIAYLAGHMNKKFNDLPDMFRERFNNVSYMFLIGVSSVVFMLLLNFSLFALSDTTFTGNQIMQTLELQLILGIVAGLAGKRLLKAITDKANNLFDEITKTETVTVEEPVAVNSNWMHQQENTMLTKNQPKTADEIRINSRDMHDPELENAFDHHDDIREIIKDTNSESLTSEKMNPEYTNANYMPIRTIRTTTITKTRR